MRHPTEEEFVELGKEVVTPRKEENWRDSLKHLKLRCDSHPGPFFIYRIVQRKENPDSSIRKKSPLLKEREGNIASKDPL
jgi:hypothetical protein